MTHIQIQNYYYMLSYAFDFKKLRDNGYKSVEAEKFENFADICAAILIKGVSHLLKRGLMREYIMQTEALSSPRGKYNLAESIKTRSLLKKQLICSYDEFSVNSYMNRIIKTTMLFLMRANVKDKRKKELKKLLMFFGDIDVLNVNTIDWKIQYNRNNHWYKILMSICEFTVNGLIKTQPDGTVKVMDFLDEQKMHALYQKFIYEYYSQEHNKSLKAKSEKKLPWAESEFKSNNKTDDNLLPVMRMDIVLSYKKKTLIIEAKHYNNILTDSNNKSDKSHYKKKLRSAHLYQIFAYVKNYAVTNTNKTISGMLLYAGTDEETQPDVSYEMSGNRISVKTLDLNCDFEEIKKQLDSIADGFIKGEI